jgi:hypothetical protein
MSESTSTEHSPLTDLQRRAADLRIAKVKAEKKAIESIGKDLSQEEKAAIEKKRREISYQLELEGAEIEREFAEKYRSELAELGLKYPGLDLSGTAGNFFCDICITSCAYCLTSCTHCISSCTNCITSCTNSVF